MNKRSPRHGPARTQAAKRRKQTQLLLGLAGGAAIAVLLLFVFHVGTAGLLVARVVIVVAALASALGARTLRARRQRQLELRPANSRLAEAIQSLRERDTPVQRDRLRWLLADLTDAQIGENKPLVVDAVRLTGDTQPDGSIKCVAGSETFALRADIGLEWFSG